MSVLGNRVLRTEDPRMLTEGARYVADLRFDGLAHACFVRSTIAHGRLVGVDTTEARTHPGVLGVFTAADLDLPDLPAVPVVNQSMGHPILVRDTIRFVGEPVAVVVAETAAAAADAAEHVVVDIEPQVAVVALPDAATGDTLVHQDAGTNIAFDMPASGHAGAPLDFSGCAVTVEATLVNQRLAAVPLEPRSAAAEWSADGTALTFHASTQAPHRVQDALAAVYGLDKAVVRVVTPDVGGGFGAKGAPSPEELVLAGLARAVGRPVVWTESRAENLTSSVHGRAQNQRLRLGGTRAGRITHYELDVVQDAGAYPMIGAFLPTYTRKVFTGCYHIANASVSGRSYVTNTAPVTAYRGARPPRGNLRHRAGRRPVRRQDRPGPRRGAPPQLRGSRALPVHQPRGQHLRLRRLRCRPRPGPGRGSIRRPASRAGPPPRRRRPDAARHRHRLIRGEHLDGSQRAGRDRACRRRVAGGAHRSHRVRSGPRHLLGHDRGRCHRRAAGSHSGHLRRYGRDRLQAG